MPEIDISVEVMEPSRGHFVYSFDTDHGALDASYDQEARRFCISSIFVNKENSRQGIGKALLQASYDKAREIEARVILSVIISRECVEAMEAVFGPSAVRVMERGSYTPMGEQNHQDADAMLWLFIK